MDRWEKGVKGLGTFWGVMEMFSILVVVIVTQVYICAQTHQTVRLQSKFLLYVHYNLLTWPLKSCDKKIWLET